uniref:Uncharacterized protein n=1 Tax=Ascaris lumbricoides TaxID=6252 RepID=A0A0M3IFH4_ASCLU
MQMHATSSHKNFRLNRQCVLEFFVMCLKKSARNAS